MKKAAIVFPHQLFEENPALDSGCDVFLVEEQLFFTQFKFHKQKLKFHRASMKFYEDHLRKNGFSVTYVEAGDQRSDVRKLINSLVKRGYETINYCDVTDNWLEKRMRSCETEITLCKKESPMFLNSPGELEAYFSGKKTYFQTKFYIDQRKKLGVLLAGEDAPEGGKWSFDAENRQKYPKGKTPPKIETPSENEYSAEAEEYVNRVFPKNYGAMPVDFFYPVTFGQSRKWFEDFLRDRFAEFGDYEDSLVSEETVLNHSVLSPLLNSGLLTPQFVIERSLEFAREENIPLNSLEGFIRQIIGWREFIRGVYEFAGSKERTKNFWGFQRKIPESFWTAKTGIEPLDLTIMKVLKTGYCHHIERLMVLGNFMLLCEFDPDEVYRWFMELFVDAYDWVMVPNVYGMSQFSDGGLFATKPYISGSNYLLKMGDYEKGSWQEIWDGLFWNFMDKQREFFEGNPRLAMLLGTLDRMDSEKRTRHFETAENFLKDLS